jgi:hypothetical protein
VSLIGNDSISTLLAWFCQPALQVNNHHFNKMPQRKDIAEIDTKEAAALIQDLAEEKENQHFYFVQISSYPNTSSKFYREVWMYLNRPKSSMKNSKLDAGMMVKGQIRWRYVKDATQTYLSSKPISEKEARHEHARIKMELMNFARRLHLTKGTGGKKFVNQFHINVLVTRAICYSTSTISKLEDEE